MSNVNNKTSVPTIGNRDLSEYKIVYTKEKSLVYADKIEAFKNFVLRYYKIDLKTVRDDREEPQECEILIGNTNRVDKVPISGENWIIENKGTKLIINGGSNTAIAAALNELLYILKLELGRRVDRKPLHIDEGFKLCGTAKKNSRDYYLAWSDEFDGEVLDRTIWRNYNSEDGSATGPTSMGGLLRKPDTTECYVENGDLVMPAYRFNKTDFQQCGGDTHDTLAVRYGIMEIRCKIAPWPCCTQFWCANPAFEFVDGNRVPRVTPRDGFLELDIMENFGNLHGYSANIHGWYKNWHVSLDGEPYGDFKHFKMPDGEVMSEDYHIYGVRWTPDKMEFALDGDVFFTYHITEEDAMHCHCPQRLQWGVSYASLNYGIQNIPDDAPRRAEAHMDYWRIYQSDKYDNILWVDPQPPQSVVEREN